MQDSPKSELPFTGERFVPHQTDPLLALEHYHRYCFASRFVKDKKVLDIACGEGYGSAFLAKWAAMVVGIDSDGPTIDHARKKYASIPNLSFELGRCEEDRKYQDSFDVIVGYEMLEHLEENDQVKFLNSVRQILKPEGLFIVSSPEKDEYAATFPARNPYHKHERTLPELKTFLGTYFKHVHLCAQRVLSLSTMWQLEGAHDAQFRFHARRDLFEEIQRGEPFSAPLYLIALCSNIPLAGDDIVEGNSFYFDMSNVDKTKDFLHWAQQLNDEAQQDRKVIQDLREQLEERTAWALDLEGQIKERAEVVNKLQGDLEERTMWVSDLKAQIKDHADVINRLQGELDRLKNEFEERTRWALSLESEVAAERAHTGQLAEKLESITAQLTTITSTFVYRALKRIKLLPGVRGY